MKTSFLRLRITLAGIVKEKARHYRVASALGVVSALCFDACLADKPLGIPEQLGPFPAALFQRRGRFVHVFSIPGARPNNAVNATPLRGARYLGC